ncbi:MAG: hypothetical protein ACI906_001754 [Candidatus Latescibacterota bacterium]|jgi:hypothetical protein
MMTEAEIYEFDLHGLIVYRNLIPPQDVARMNELIDADQGDEFPGSFQFLKLDPTFMNLMSNPRTLGIMRTIIGDWLRLDHSYGLQMTKDSDVRENLHGGLRTDQGEHQYQWAYNRMWNGLIVVMYALEDVELGDGGFVGVLGSHKANINTYKPPLDSPLVFNPTLKAGDMLIFTESLVHGTLRWNSDKRRRSLLYKYSPGYSSWSKADQLDQYLEVAQTDLQRDLLRPPYVGSRTPLDFPEA